MKSLLIPVATYYGHYLIDYFPLQLITLIDVIHAVTQLLVVIHVS